MTDKGFIEIVALLLDQGAKIDMQDKEDLTPLMWAAQSGHLDIVKLLLVLGGNQVVKDLVGETAQAKAEKRGHRQIVSLLEAWQDKNK